MKRNLPNIIKVLLPICTLALAACSSTETIVPTKYNDISAYNPHDYQKAYAFFEQAAAQGDANAMDNLGHMYEDGRGVAANDKQAVAWYLKAAKAGDNDAYIDMGVACLYGKGMSKDTKQACSWFKKARDNQYAVSFYNQYC